MKSRLIKVRILLVIASTVLAIFGMELAARLVSRIRHGPNHLDLKIAERAHYLFPSVSQRLNASRAWDDTLQLHPLFGYVLLTNRPGANNYGFTCDQDFTITENGYALPDSDRSKTIILGVFGGSFARVTTYQTKAFLSKELARIFPGRTPVVLNFAQAGYALPQTFNIFSYFRSLVDISVFIDGLNEPWNYYKNNISGFPPEYAKATHWTYKLSLNELSPSTFEATSQILRQRRLVKSVTAFSLRPVVKRSVLVYYLWRHVCRRSEREVAEITRSIEESYARTGTKFHDVPDDVCFRFCATQWREYHELIHSLSSQAGLLDLHVLQPNPYAPGRSKILTETESTILARGDGGTKYIVTNAFPLLRAELNTLGERGVACLDLTDMFHDQTDTIWADYCHANTRGGMLVAREIIREIEKRSERWQPPHSESRVGP